MATLTLIGEPFPDAEAAAQAEAAQELARAVAANAPRGCSARLLIAADRPAPVFTNARASAERLPLNTALLPVLWRAGVTARPLDGEMVHAPTPMVALRARGDHDDSQTSVMVPHALGWLAPEAMGSAHARQYRAFVKRAVKHADVLLAPTHATAAAVQNRYGAGTNVQVMPLAAPPSYLAGRDAAERREALGLPDRYLVTTAEPGEFGRLDWALGALEADPALPPLVVLLPGLAPVEHEHVSASSPASAASSDARSVPVPVPAPASASAAASASASASVDPESTGSRPVASDSTASDRPVAPTEVSHGGSAHDAAGAADGAIPDHLRDRVLVVHPRELADIGAVLAAAKLLVLPQPLLGTGFEVLGAIAAGVPVLHGDCAVAAELALEAGVAAKNQVEFADELSRLCTDDQELNRLSVHAKDRSRSFTWSTTAVALWELHANL